MTASRQIPALDGWRGLSILLVLAAHLDLVRFFPGGLGVTVFFFISGWLISGQLLDERSRRGGIDLGRFYGRRAMRLLPASCAFVVIAGSAYVACGGVMRPAAWAAALFYVANYAELTTRLFDTSVHGLSHPFVILWSLAIEEQFYLVWPILVVMLGVRRRPWLLMALGGCIAACLLWRIHLAPICAHLHACGPHGDDWIGKSTDTRADSLAFGALAAVLQRSTAGRFERWLRTERLVLAGAALLLLTVLVRDEWFRDTWRFTLQGLALMLLVPGSTIPGSTLGALLGAPPLVAVGRLSYGLYLWHWLALMLVSRMGGTQGSGAWFLILTAAFTLTSWYAIERPMIRLRRRFGSQVSDRLVPEAARVRRRDPVVAG